MSGHACGMPVGRSHRLSGLVADAGQIPLTSAGERQSGALCGASRPLTSGLARDGSVHLVDIVVPRSAWCGVP
jgi:hypothetical protein